jgi:hypothetical protein
MNRRHLSHAMLGLLFFFGFRSFLFSLMVMQLPDSESQLSATLCESPKLPFTPSLGIREAEYYGPCNSVFCVFTVRTVHARHLRIKANIT